MKIIKNLFREKLFFVFALNFLFFSSNFALTIIFDFAALVNNCSGQRILAPSFSVEGEGFLKFRQNFIRPNRVSLNPSDFLMDVCSILSTNLYGKEGDIVRRLYQGQVKLDDFSEFLLSAESVIQSNIAKKKFCEQEVEALRVIKHIFWGQSHCASVPRSNRDSIISFIDCFNRGSGFYILKHIVESRKNHGLYLIGDAPKKWVNLYKDKFGDVFSYFPKDNIRFSYQAESTVETLDFYLNFFQFYKKMDPSDCLLITCNPNLYFLNQCGLKVIYFDPNQPQKAIELLKQEGVLNSEQRYFIPGV